MQCSAQFFLRHFSRGRDCVVLLPCLDGGLSSRFDPFFTVFIILLLLKKHTVVVVVVLAPAAVAAAGTTQLG